MRTAESSAPSGTALAAAPAPAGFAPLAWLAGGGRLVTLAAQAVFTALLLAAWEVASRTIIPQYWISRPTLIAGVLAHWIRGGILASQLVPTLKETAVGFVCGALAGSSAGFVLGYLRALDKLLAPMVTSVYTLPKIALAPLVILWFGIGFTAKAVLSALLVFFPIFFNTHAGVREADQDFVNAARLMGASPRALLRYVYLPHAAAWMFTGLRLALPYALVGAVIGEMLASNQGIGYLLASAANQFDTAAVFAALAVLVAVGLLLNTAVGFIEARVQRWQPQRLAPGNGW
jgi:sulfonate transport system permease protein